MFPLNLNLLIGILIAIAILAYISILKKIRPEKILENFSPKKTPNRQRHEKKEEKQKPKKNEPEKKPEMKEKKNEKNGAKKSETKRKKDGKPRESNSSSPGCTHKFGYLGTLPKNASIPDECLGCTKIIECLAEK